MDRLWAPWRLRYVETARPASPDCVFCAAATGVDDEAHHVLWRGEHCYAMLNRYPYNNGHLMILPYDHVAWLDEVSAAGQAEMIHSATCWTNVLREVMNCDGFNLGWNLGTAAGAGIAMHLHLHVVPRWTGDTNFMPVTGDVKVIPEDLGQTWRKLRGAWLERCDGSHHAGDSNGES